MGLPTCRQKRRANCTSSRVAGPFTTCQNASRCIHGSAASHSSCFSIGPGNATTFLSQYLTTKAVGQFDLGPAAAFSLIYFFIILLLCFILYNWMQRVGTASQEGVGHE